MPKQTHKTFHQIWKQMDPARRRQAADEFATGADYAAGRQRAAIVIAAKLHLRAQKAAKLPPEKIAAYLTSISSLDEDLAGTLIRAYLFSQQSSMLSTFLDELQIPHQQGAISDETVTPPDTDALRVALERIRSTFDPVDVEIYLSALLASDAETWVNLDTATQMPDAQQSGANP